MKSRVPLSTKIFLHAFVNLLALAVILLVFARLQFHFDFHSFLFGGAEDRIMSVAQGLALDLEMTPVGARDALLQKYKKAYGVDFYLLERPARQIAGAPVQLPQRVLDEVGQRPPARRAPPPPPRPAEEYSGIRPGPPPREEPRPEEPRPEEPRPEDRGAPRVFQITTADPTMYWVGARIPIREPGAEAPTPGTLLMAANSLTGTPFFFDYKPWLALAACVIIAGILCWLPFVRGLTRTIARMSKATDHIAEGQFDRHLKEDRSDELGQLAGNINRMATRLAGFVTGQKRFLGDIAHELCAPIARIQFALGILEHKTDPGTVDDLQEEIGQMSELVGELLSFSKSGMQPDARPLVAVDVAETVAQAIAREAGTARVDTNIPEGIAASADREYLLRAISNLVRNAVRYAGDAGPVVVTARRVDGEVSITVADRGPGLPEGEIDRVFTPFYRVETSRNRASGGVGLGLAIVKNCIEACKGTVRCRNLTPSGLEVEIRLATAELVSARLE